MVKKIKAITTEEYLSEICSETNKKIMSLASRNKLPYLDKGWKPKPVNAVSGLSRYDLNRQIQEIDAADKSIEKSLLVNAADAELLGLTLKNTTRATPVFTINNNGRLDVQFAHFLDEFSKDSIVRAFSKVREENEDPITEGKVHYIAQKFVQSVVEYNSGNEDTAKKEKESRKNIKENISADKGKFSQAIDFIKGRTKNADEKLVMAFLENYYANQEAGRIFIAPRKSKSAFKESCARLAKRGAFLNTAFNSMIGALRLATKEFGLENPDKMKLPKRAFVNPPALKTKNKEKEQIKNRERNISKDVEIGPQSRSR